jgi:hypothetical protein
MEDNMKKVFNRLIGVVLFAVVVSVGFLAVQASATTCGITEMKVAPGAGDLPFVFQCENTQGSCTFTLVAGEISGADIEQGDFVVIREQRTPGYRFGGIECEGGPGLIVTQTGDGWTENCVDPDNGFVVCTIFNDPDTESLPVPTLSEWGMLAAAGGLMLVGLFFAVRRRRIADAG